MLKQQDLNLRKGQRLLRRYIQESNHGKTGFSVKASQRLMVGTKGRNWYGWRFALRKGHFWRTRSSQWQIGRRSRMWLLRCRSVLNCKVSEIYILQSFRFVVRNFSRICWSSLWAKQWKFFGLDRIESKIWPHNQRIFMQNTWWWNPGSLLGKVYTKWVDFNNGFKSKRGY